MEPLEELYLKEYDDYIYKDVKPEIVKPGFPELDPISKAITSGISGAQSDFETDPAEALYGTGKGVVQGTYGLPGDLISLVRGLVDVAQTPEGKSKLDAFLSGTEKPTGLPTTMDIKMFLEDTLGVPESSAEYAEGFGEIIAPATVVTKTSSKVMKVVGKNKAKQKKVNK